MKKALLLSSALAIMSGLQTEAALPPKGEAKHVVVIVMDGMRRDFISPQYTPNLYSMAQAGTFFRNHHCVYLSTTEVNGTALMTGVYPEHSGIMANNDYRPEINFMGSIATEGIDNIRRGDLLSGGHYLLTPTLPEILQQNDMPTAVAGTKPVVLLSDRKARRKTQAETNSCILFAGQTIPKSALKQFEKANDDKKFPATNSTPNSDKDNWTSKALIKSMWSKTVPAFSLLWLYDPDSTQHAEGVGSDQAMAGIGNSDRILEDVLKALEEKRVRDKTDVIVISDHGFANVKRGPDVVEAMKKSKIKAVKKFEDPEPGEVLVVGHGGSMSFYVVDHEEKVIRQVVEFLQGCDFTGVVFSRVNIEGTFPMSAAHINTTNVTPDVVISMRWYDERNDVGTYGLLAVDGGAKGKGTHGSLSPAEINNNILVASGPDFKKGFVNDVPTGNVDLVANILWALGVKTPTPLDGRVWQEALAKDGTRPEVKTDTMNASRDFGIFRWQQYLKISKVGTTDYLDQGNGSQDTK